MKRHLTKRRRESILHACEVLELVKAPVPGLEGFAASIGVGPMPSIKLSEYKKASLKLATSDSKKGKP